MNVREFFESLPGAREPRDLGTIDRALAILYGQGEGAGLWQKVGWKADAVALRYVAGMTWGEVGRALGYSAHYVSEQAQDALMSADAPLNEPSTIT